MIQPSIGRKVWFWPVNDSAIVRNSEAIPCDATVIYPWGDTCVNLRITDHGGTTHIRTSVFLHQGDVESRPPSNCATWMPYQQTQAKKAEA